VEGLPTTGAENMLALHWSKDKVGVCLCTVWHPLLRPDRDFPMGLARGPWAVHHVPRPWAGAHDVWLMGCATCP